MKIIMKIHLESSPSVVKHLPGPRELMCSSVVSSLYDPRVSYNLQGLNGYCFPKLLRNNGCHIWDNIKRLKS